ncbi:MAG: CPBP family intramembrane metalloprotease [Actinomycetota bacterium]|nr:CPBP family intramembrane metalloprotease [Actinomycetota bacterium]
MVDTSAVRPESLHRLWQFAVVCLALTWVPWAVLGALGLDVNHGVAQVVFALAASGPSSAALVMWLNYRRDGARTRIPVRISWSWPLDSVILGAAPTVLAALCLHATDVSTIPRHAASVVASVGGPIAVLGYLLISGPLSEEFGWRGYVQPRLRQRFGRIRTSVVLGSGWALWHVPLFLLNGTGQHEIGLFTTEGVLFFITLIPLSYTILLVSEHLRGGVWAAVITEGYSGRAYGFVSLQVRAAFLKIILPPE